MIRELGQLSEWYVAHTTTRWIKEMSRPKTTQGSPHSVENDGSCSASAKGGC